MTLTGEHPYIFKLEKYKSVAIEFLGDTIFLPGMDMLPIKISILFVFSSKNSKCFCVYYPLIWPSWWVFEEGTLTSVTIHGKTTGKNPTTELCTCPLLTLCYASSCFYMRATPGDSSICYCFHLAKLRISYTQSERDLIWNRSLGMLEIQCKNKQINMLLSSLKVRTQLSEKNK